MIVSSYAHHGPSHPEAPHPIGEAAQSELHYIGLAHYRMELGGSLPSGVESQRPRCKECLDLFGLLSKDS